MKIRIGTRKSPLALAQAGMIRQKLMEIQPDLRVELVHIVTSGDKFTDKPLADMGGKGLFTKEIEDGLLDGSIDMAVHSVKDMQTVLPDGLILGCVPEREDVRDVLIGAKSIADIPSNATFGTSSLRRAAQVLIRRPDIKIVPLRGNVQTRIAKIEQGEIAATMLAKAGLNRLGLDLGAPIPISEVLPAVGQGALGIECRENDDSVRGLLAPLSHPISEAAVTCERAFLRAVDGSCRLPIAGYAVAEKSLLRFEGFIAGADGSNAKHVRLEGAVKDAENIGFKAGKEILKKI